MKNKDLKEYILKLSKEHGLTHLGSCLTQVDILEEIYREKGRHDIVLLSSGHSGLALYCVLQKYHGINAEYLLKKHGIHPNRSVEDEIYTSAGSLGHGWGIAIGYAIAQPFRVIHVVSTDGEVNEGSCMEALRFITDNVIKNIRIHINWNSYTAYQRSSEYLETILGNHPSVTIHYTKNDQDFPWLEGMKAHYIKVPEEVEV